MFTYSFNPWLIGPMILWLQLTRAPEHQSREPEQSRAERFKSGSQKAEGEKNDQDPKPSFKSQCVCFL